MKCLTICQPYPELILLGQKRVENRVWEVKYRGPMLIHAGKSTEFLQLNKGDAREAVYNLLVEDLVFGAIVGYCHVIECAHIDDIRSGKYDKSMPWLRAHEHASGPWCWVLDRVGRFETPILYKGQLGLFNVSSQMVKHARSAAPEFGNG